MRIEYHAHACRLVEKPSPAVEERLRELTVYEPKEDFSFAKQRALKKRGFGVKIDPRRYLYHKGSRTFPTGLLQEVLEAFPGSTLEQVHSFQVPGAKPFALAPSARTPRPYQQEAWQALTEAGRGVAILPTGCGKTMLAAMLASSYPGCRVLITTPSSRLLHQNRNDMALQLGCEVGILGDGERELAPLWVANIQSLASRIEAEDAEVLQALAAVDVWICDESHGAAATSYRLLSQHLPAAHVRFGITASWLREDGCQRVMEGVLGSEVVYEYTYERAFAEGYLTPIQVLMRWMPHPTRLQGRKPPYKQAYDRRIVGYSARNLRVCLDVAELVEAGLTPCLVMVNRIEHGKHLAQLLDAPFINGSQQTKAVDQMLARFCAGEVPVLVASSILNVGVDLPILASAVNAAAGDSRVAARQKPGRGLRLFAGKARFWFVDYLDDEPQYFRKHSITRRFTYKSIFPSRVRDVKFENVKLLKSADCTKGGAGETPESRGAPSAAGAGELC
jgi:superfamily II DNA or RNA helicase